MEHFAWHVHAFHVQRKNLIKINFTSLPRVSQLRLFLIKNRSGPASKFVSNLDFFGNYSFDNFKKPSPSFQRADPPDFDKSSTPTPPRFKISRSNSSTYFQSFRCFSVFCSWRLAGPRAWPGNNVGTIRLADLGLSKLLDSLFSPPT